jgi:Tfp pilus assembly protein PilO
MDAPAAFPAPYGNFYKPSGYEFSVQGGYHDLAHLASRIEGHEKLLRIQSFRIVTSGKSPERHITGLKLWAFVVPPPAAVKSPAAGANSVKK